jgi:hypothetical protein
MTDQSSSNNNNNNSVLPPVQSKVHVIQDDTQEQSKEMVNIMKNMESQLEHIEEKQATLVANVNQKLQTLENTVNLVQNNTYQSRQKYDSRGKSSFEGRGKGSRTGPFNKNFNITGASLRTQDGQIICRHFKIDFNQGWIKKSQDKAS